MAISESTLAKHFGPKIIIALALVIKDEINVLRVNAGLPERTNQQVLDAINTKLEAIPDYDWMNENTWIKPTSDQQEINKGNKKLKQEQLKTSIIN